MRSRTLAVAGLATTLGAVALTGCAGGSGTPASAPAVRPGAPGTVINGYHLLTRCGIDEAIVGGRYYEAIRPLSDGHGDPPPGWGSPFQTGTMAVTSATRAVFTDPAGHRVVFRLRPGATTFKHWCG